MISLVGVFLSLTLTLISLALPFWLRVRSPVEVPSARSIDYGLYVRCESRATNLPSMYLASPTSPRPPWEIEYEYVCAPFPERSVCKHLGESFCIFWSAAGYTPQLGIWFLSAALLVTTLANLSTRSRRRSAWKIVASLIGVHATFQITSMSLVISMHRSFPSFFARGAYFSVSLWLNIVSWILDILLVTGLVVTGLYAEKGHRWAAGRRPYHPIPG